MRLTRNIMAPMSHIFQLVFSLFIRMYPRAKGSAISMVPEIRYDTAIMVVKYYLVNCALSSF